MTMLSINHGAKGIVMWIFPTTDELVDVTSRLAKVLTEECAKFILGAPLLKDIKVTGGDSIDVSAWLVDDTLLVSIVNPAYEALNGILSIDLPGGTKAQDDLDSLWGDGTWQASPGSSMISKQGMLGLEVDILTLRVVEGAVSAALPQTS